MVQSKDIIEWCLVLGALILSVYGFLFSVYINLINTDKPPPPEAAVFLRTFCRVLAGVLIALCAISIWSGATSECFIGWQAWAVIACFFVTVVFSAILTTKLGW